MTIGCGDKLDKKSKSDKNIGADGWHVDNLFEAADSCDVVAHLRITTA